MAFVRCDKCSRKYPNDAGIQEIDYAIKKAKQRDWKVTNSEDLCPKCKGD